MKIYLSHSSSMEYRTELYQPIRNSELNGTHEFILPHEESGEPLSSKEIIATCDLVIADITEKSTGSGIEIGWAHAQGVPVVCVYREGARFSPSIRTVTNRISSYQDSVGLIAAINAFVSEPA